MTEIPINDLTPRNRYVAAGGEADFDYTFPIFAQGHLVVQQTNPADLDNPVTLTIGTHYTVTGVGAKNGGTIVLNVVAYPTGATDDYIYTITRAMPLERLVDYQYSGDFETDDVNRDFDSLLLMIQQNDRKTGKAVSLDDTDELTALPIKVETTATRIGRALAFDATGEKLEASFNAADIANASTNAAQVAADKITVAADKAATEGFKIAAEAAAVGMKWRPSVKCAAVSNITLSGLQTIDAYTTIAGDRVLVKGQSTSSQNGVYVAAAGSWSRATDADAWAELVSQAVIVEQGTTYADSFWICTVNDGGTLGTTAITWSQFVLNPTTISLLDGSAASPSFSFLSDPDVGIFRRSANVLSFSTAGTEAGFIASGILGVYGNATNAAGVSLYEDTDNGTNAITVRAAASIGADRTQILADRDGHIPAHPSEAIQFAAVTFNAVGTIESQTGPILSVTDTGATATWRIRLNGTFSKVFATYSWKAGNRTDAYTVDQYAQGVDSGNSYVDIESQRYSAGASDFSRCTIMFFLVA